jgi:hypothetical protein
VLLVLALVDVCIHLHMFRRYLYLELAFMVMVMGMERITRKLKDQPVRARAQVTTVLEVEDIIIIHISDQVVRVLVLMVEVHMVLLHRRLIYLGMG